jgi:haloacetate dehalogenase
MSDGIIAGFEQRQLHGDGVEIDTLVAGSGPPLLLLHGWPQTRMCWASVAPRLAETYTVVVPDLRGYGRSGAPEDSADHTAYSKRSMARDQIAIMQALGFDRFHLAGHDRGGRVSYRLALDYSEAVIKLACLDIVPTADTWAAMGAKEAVAMWHWPFLVQPDGLPEMMIGADPEAFVRYILTHQSPGFAFPKANVADYVACARNPKTIHAWCEDYRAGWGIDRDLDEADCGRKLEMPLLVLWGEHGSLKRKNGVKLWQPWAAHVEGEMLPCGHFIPEEQPDAVVEHLLTFFGE